MFCGNCGAQNNDDAAFCLSCGAPLKMKSASSQGGQGQSYDNPAGDGYAGGYGNSYGNPTPPPQGNYGQPGQGGSGSGSEPGKGSGIASMVLGIIGVVFWFFGYSSLLSIILGAVGLVLASNSKKAGYDGGMRTAGFVLSLIALIGGSLVFIACIACTGAVASIGLLSY